MAAKTVVDCIKDLEESQEADRDNREMVREADHFLNKRDGQWEQSIINRWNRKPRYTFDECNPIVDDIMGEMEAMDFDIRVNPAGGDSSKDVAQAYEGIIRNIENISGAGFVYNAAARAMVGTGLGGWRIVQAWRDDDSIQQDLMIKRVHNAQDSMWLDPNAVEQDGSDSDSGWLLTSMTRSAYKKQYPKGSGLSVGRSLTEEVYFYKKSNEVVVGEYMYVKERDRELALLSNNSVVALDDKWEEQRDRLAAMGITIVRTRTRKQRVVYHRIFDGTDWLSDEMETVFQYIPIIPVYGNYRLSEDKPIYWGVVEKLMDAQRVKNYAESRKIEEGALSPRGKVWMEKDQATSPDVKKTLSTLNTNTDPVQFYDHVEGVPPPGYQGSPVSNPGLIETSQSASDFIQRTSGTYDEARGTAPANRSGEAIQLLQNKSDNPKRKWFTAMEIPLTHTCRILIKAIPRVYDTTQEMRIIGKDGSPDTVTIYERVHDGKGNVVELLDLSKGQYDVTCSAGPAFQSRQQETVSAINEIAAIDPSIMEIGADILLNNINAPGIEQIAERKRALMVKSGVIPFDQLTDDEKEMVQQQQQQGNQPSPIDQANLMIAQAELEDTQGRNQERALKLQLEQQKLALKEMELTLRAQTEQSKMQLTATTEIVNQIKMQAETLKSIREAMGVDAVVTPAAMSAFEGQTRELNQSIRTQP